MKIPNINHECEQAKLFYYDFLSNNFESEIPVQILRHIRNCDNCQKLIFKLKSALAQTKQTNSNTQDEQGTPLVKMLNNHLSYIDKDINCKIVKPFLPEMLDSSIRISIPTPITAHLDYCPECIKDLRQINNFNLSNKNLSRLSQIFKAKQEGDNINCSKARSNIMAFVMMAFQESEVKTLNHLCVCKQCSSAVEKYRGSIMDVLLADNGNKPCFLSTKITYDEIFDYVFPFELDIAQYKASEFHKSRISHIRRCPFCLEKLQDFQHIINDIHERSDSEITTKYLLGKSNQNVNVTNTHELYEGYPVSVEVSNVNEVSETIKSGSTINFTAALKRKILASNFKTYYKTGFAGIFLVGFILAAMFISSQNVEAFNANLSKLNNSIQKANNVHITTFMQGIEKVFEEQWISRSENVTLTKYNNELTLVDVDEQTITTGNINSSDTYTEIIPNEKISVQEKFINSSLGLTPFYSIPKVKKDAKWEKIETDSQSQNSETEIYQLLFIEDTFSDPVSCKILYTVKAVSGEPIKVEFFQKLSQENEYSLTMWKTIEYLEDEEFINIKNSFFSN